MAGGEEWLEGVVRKRQCHYGLGRWTDDDEVNLKHTEV